MASLARTLVISVNRIGSRALHFSRTNLGQDAREHRAAHVRKTDLVEGERFVQPSDKQAYELIDENLMERVIDNVKFKDIPIVHITCTRNNTKICLITSNNRSLARKSAGTEGFKHCRKGTTVAAQAVANRVITNIKDLNIDKIRLVFNGLGPGRDAAYKVFELSGIRVVSLSDRTEAIEPWIKRPRAAKSI